MFVIVCGAIEYSARFTATVLGMQAELVWRTTCSRDDNCLLHTLGIQIISLHLAT